MTYLCYGFVIECVLVRYGFSWDAQDVVTNSLLTVYENRNVERLFDDKNAWASDEITLKCRFLYGGYGLSNKFIIFAFGGSTPSNSLCRKERALCLLSGLDVCKASLFVGYMGERGFILWSGCFFHALADGASCWRQIGCGGVAVPRLGV